MGVNNLIELFNEKYYENLPGGILESFGRLFRNSVKLYIYPMRTDLFARYLNSTSDEQPKTESPSFTSNVMITARNLLVTPNLQNLYQHLLENRFLECVSGYDEKINSVYSRDELKKIKENDSSWEKVGPPQVAEIIKQRRLFGYNA